MDSLSYRLGHHVGVFVVQARKTLRAVHPVVSEDETVAEVAVSLKELDATPAMVRKGINLNDWYARNVTPATPDADVGAQCC